jgi:thiol:disulfide interchange protein DsbA
MKHALTIIALLTLAVACGKQDPAEQIVIEEPVVEEQAVEEAAVEEAAVEETHEIVEESAAEPEPEEEAIILAQADPVEAPQSWKYSEGTHYTRMVPTQPTVGGADKVEVTEFFMYSCPHCADFEPIITKWAEDRPANSRLVKMPVVWNPIAMLHGRMFFTAEVLARNGVIKDANAFHMAVFQEVHRRGNRLASETAIQNFFARFDVSSEDFNKTWNSFEVDQKLRVAGDIMRRYKIDGVPTVVVNGKYRTGANAAGGYPELLELINELIVRESLR